MRQTRSEPRLPVSTAVRVFGLDSAGHPVNATVNTVDISRRGARISGLQHWERPGDVIGIRHGQEKARYQIMWIGDAETPVQGQMGLMCVEIGKVIWGDALPQAKAAAGSVASDTVSFRPGANPLGPSTGSFRPDVKPAGSVRVGARASGAGRTPNHRASPRYVVEGGVHIREQGALSGQWATVHDISLGGCYVETTSPLPLDAYVEAALNIGDVQFQAHGVVANSHPMTGMGIKFTELSPAHRARLETLIATLSQNQPQP